MMKIVIPGGSRISQPPGKKLQNMMQPPSGGEKAFNGDRSAFAIQHLKPSPFCLFWLRTEAALDERMSVAMQIIRTS